MSINVYGGTVKGSKNLCDECRFGQKIVGHGGQEVVRCGAMPESPVFMQFSVAKCSFFQSEDFIPRNELEKTAIILDGTHKRHEGFAGGKK